MSWWQWLLVLWVGGTVGLAILLGLVIGVQMLFSRFINRSGAEGQGAPSTIDLRDAGSTADHGEHTSRSDRASGCPTAP